MEEKACWASEENSDSHTHQLLQTNSMLQTTSSLNVQFNQKFSEFLKEIQTELIKNQNIYNKFIQSNDIQGILNIFECMYVEKQTAKKIVNSIINFFCFCRKFVNNDQPQPQVAKYILELAKKLFNLKYETFLINKSQLKILSYIVKEPESGRRQYEGCFQDLKFNLCEEESKQVAETVFKMAKEDIRSFCFLTNYFLLSCYELQKEGVSLTDVKEKYKKILNFVRGFYRAAPKIEAYQNAINKHKNRSHQQLIPSLSVSLRGQPNKQQTLELFIMERAKESIDQKERFQKMMKEICEKNGGFRFKVGVKLKDRGQHQALLRIKEKMLGQQNLKRLDQRMKNLKFEDTLSIKEVIFQEKVAYQKQMQQIFQAQDQLCFKVDDMLRGKCLFAAVDNINDCCQEILDTLAKEENKDIKLIKLSNRLKKSTSDINLKILFGNVIAELQLAINLIHEEYEFDHKLYELTRLTPLTQLSNLNEYLSTDYFAELNQVIKANTRRKKGEDYKAVVSYEEVSKYFPSFLEKLPVKIDLTVKENGMDQKFLQKQILFFEATTIRELHPTDKLMFGQSSFYQGLYLYQIKQIERGEQKFKQICQNIEEELQNEIIEETLKDKKKQVLRKALNYRGSIQQDKGYDQIAMEYYKKSFEIAKDRKKQNLLEVASDLQRIGSVYQNRGDSQTAMKCFKRSLSIQDKVNGKDNINSTSTLNQFGLMYYSQGNIPKAAECFERCLQIEKKVKDKNSLERAFTLKNIGLIQKDQGNLEKSMQCFMKCLEIQERVNGKMNIYSVTTLENIGLIYESQGHYQKAYEYYQKCRQIQENVNGKGSIDSASILHTIGQFFYNQGNSPKAIEFFKQCLLIEEKVKGKDSIDSASTFISLGLAYQQQGNYQLAIKLYEKCLQIEKSVKGKDSLDSVSILFNISTIFLKKQDYPNALQYFQKYLQIQEKVNGKDNISILNKIDEIEGKVCIDRASILNNMGSIYESQGNYSKAIECFRNCLYIVIQKQGFISLDSSATLHTIGSIYDSQGRYYKAIFYYTMCIQIFNLVKDKRIIDIVPTYTNIGFIERHLGNYKKSIQYFIKCLQIVNQVKGKNSIDSAFTHYNIGLVYKDQGNYKQALQSFLISLQIQEKVKGKNSKDRASILNSIGMTYSNMKIYNIALLYFSQSKDIFIKFEEPNKAKIPLEHIAEILYKTNQINAFNQIRQQILELQNFQDSEDSEDSQDSQDSQDF